MNIKYLAPSKTAMTADLSISNQQAAQVEHESEFGEGGDFKFHQELKDENGEVTVLVDGIYQARTFFTKGYLNELERWKEEDKPK